MTRSGWQALVEGVPWFRTAESYPIAAYSEFMPPPREFRKPYQGYVVGELNEMVEQWDLPTALDWATTGVELILQGSGESGGQTYAGLNELLRLRYRIRNDLRLPEDEYDRMLSA